ncbi:MAG: hypothetical protein V1721_03330 [Pseudomonadota bacterium]
MLKSEAMPSLARKLASSTALTPANDNFRFRLVRSSNTADANGNVTQAGATTYGYDALDRVNAENPGSSISYTYDATSNRLTKVSGGTTTTTVPSTSNKISAVGGNSYLLLIFLRSFLITGVSLFLISYLLEQSPCGIF